MRMSCSLVAPVAILLTTASALCAVDAPLPVTVRDFKVQPGGNLTYLDDRLELHPKALLSLGYDSNPLQRSSGARKDWFQLWQLGLEARLRLTPENSIEGEFDIFGRNYTKENTRDIVGGLVDIRVRHQTATAKWYASGGWERGDDPLIETGRTVQQDHYNAYGEGVYLGNRTQAGVGVQGERTRYLEDGATFSAAERDRNRADLIAFGNREYSSATNLGLRGNLFTTRYDKSDGRFQNSVGGRLVGTGELGLEQRLQLSVKLGLEARRYAHDFAQDPAYDDQQVISPVGSAELAWAYDQGSELSAKVRYFLAESDTSNYVHAGELTLGAAHLLPSLVTVFGDVDLVNVRNSGAPAGASVSARNTTALTGGASYQFRDGIATRLRARWRHQSGSSSEQYSQLLLAWDLAFAF